jgi:hypothetical protein
MPREILRITPETVYGTYASGNAHTVVDLNADNAFTMRPMPKFWEIPSAGLDNRIALTGTQVSDVDGDLMILGRPSQSALIASLIADLTSGSCPDLPSCTIDHAIFIEDGSCTPKYRRYLGVKATGGFELNNAGDFGSLMMWKLKLMAASAADITGTDFPTPAYSGFTLSERPFVFADATGTVTYGGVDISPYCESLAFDVGSQLMPFRGASKYRTRVRAFGRRPTITMRMLYYTQQARIDFEANTAKSLVIVFTQGLETLTINFGATNFLRQVGDDLKLGDFHRQTIQLMNTVDPATGADFTVVYDDGV